AVDGKDGGRGDGAEAMEVDEHEVPVLDRGWKANSIVQQEKRVSNDGLRAMAQLCGEKVMPKSLCHVEDDHVATAGASTCFETADDDSLAEGSVLRVMAMSPANAKGEGGNR
ncbi:unnamed protein product, partial [Choristocarpus tenellus]